MFQQWLGVARLSRDRMMAAIPAVTASRFARDATLLTAVTAVERLAALLQTVLIARALGIAEYGMYGLLFTTIGFVSAVVGLQMGLTATVLVARYRENEKPKATAVIAHVNRFALLVALVFCAASLPFAGPLSEWLLGAGGYEAAIVLGCLFVGLSLLSGVQDGIAQGFEDFRMVAYTRFICSLLSLLAVYPAALLAGLEGVIGAILLGLALKQFLLQRVIRRHRRAYQLPANGAGVEFSKMVLGFSLPSMLATLTLGGVTWWGSFLLSRQQDGFESVALVNTGLQWRGPVLMLAASLGSVAVPMFSRLTGAQDHVASRDFKRRMLWLNGAIATLMCLVIIVFSELLLNLYGEGFQEGVVVFALLVATTVPMVVANVYMQELVGAGMLWRQLLLHIPMALLMAAGFALLVPRMGGLGYALSTAAASMLFLTCAVIGRRRLA